MASPCALPPQWREYGEGLNDLMPDRSQTYGRLFFTHEVVRGSKEITVSGSFGLEVHRQEKLRKRNHLPLLVVLGPAFVQNPALSRIMIYATLADVEALLRAILRAPSFRPLLAWHLIGETPLPLHPAFHPIILKQSLPCFSTWQHLTG